LRNAESIIFERVCLLGQGTAWVANHSKRKIVSIVVFIRSTISTDLVVMRNTLRSNVKQAVSLNLWYTDLIVVQYYKLHSFVTYTGGTYQMYGAANFLPKEMCFCSCHFCWTSNIVMTHSKRLMQYTAFLPNTRYFCPKHVF